MKYLTVNEICVIWGVSQQLIRRLCREGRIPEAQQSKDGWLIPEGAERPGRRERHQTTRKAPQAKPQLTRFAKKIAYQKSKNNHYGIYEYIQVNLTYSSNRMASNRLTRNEVEELYRTNKISTSFEPAKVDDIIETINHFTAIRFLVDNITAPISQALIKKLHSVLTYGTYADRKENIHPGKYRTKPSKFGVHPTNISSNLSSLITDYETCPSTVEQIIDFHARFEMIHPFEDYNGRVGRLIMMKECLRYGIDPFIIDDKRRSAYFKGIAAWNSDHEPLMSVSFEAQNRFKSKMELFNTLQYARYPERE